jgi:hypothetical protein
MAGLVYLWLAANGSSWGLFGLLPLLTGIFGWCPPYQLLGISTVDTSCTNSDSTVKYSDGHGPQQSHYKGECL